MPGLFVFLNLGRRSVPRGGRATPVEAIDEFGGDGLNVSVTTIEGVERTRRTAPSYYSSSTDLRRGVMSVVSEAIFTFPEQTREGDVAETATNSPRPVIFYLTDKTAWAGTRARAAEIIVSLDVRPLSIG